MAKTLFLANEIEIEIESESIFIIQCKYKRAEIAYFITFIIDANVI